MYNRFFINVAPALLHLLFIMQIFFFILPVSQSILKVVLVAFILLLFLMAILQKSVIKKWSYKSIQSVGIIFFSWYALAITFGFLYGYSYSYVLVNLLFVIPLFLILFIPRKVDVHRCLNIIFIYSVIALIVSIVELLLWEHISWLHQMVINSYDKHGLSKIYSDDHGVKAFGFYSNAVSNGLLLMFGLVISLVKSRKHMGYAAMGILFLVVLYFTYTRNNYLTALVAVLFWMLLRKSNTFLPYNKLWHFALFLLLSIMAAAALYTLLSFGSTSINAFSGESSIQARVISWGIIFNDYIFSQITSPHILFGYGLTQLENDMSPEKTYWAIDNSVFMVFLSGGAMGVYLFFSWVKHALKVLCQTYPSASPIEKENIQIIIIILLCYFVNGAMNATILGLTTLLPIMLLISAYARKGMVTK
jgi:hypothetical protein